MLKVQHKDKNITAVWGMVELIVDLYYPARRSYRLFRMFRSNSRYNSSKKGLSQRLSLLKKINKKEQKEYYSVIIQAAEADLKNK